MENNCIKVQADLKEDLARVAVHEQEDIVLNMTGTLTRNMLKNLSKGETGMSPNLKTEIKRDITTSIIVYIITLCSLIKNIVEEILTLKEDNTNNDNTIWKKFDHIIPH